MPTKIFLSQNRTINGTASALPASKSISNRALIVDALAGGGSTLENLSDANDTQLMLKLLRAHDALVDVEDAGTTMRFLTAYFAATRQQKTITGTERMKQRPIAILVEALRNIGADITYLEKEGYPPVLVKGFHQQAMDTIAIRGDVSSQYISALMMIAPTLPRGLNLQLTGNVGSLPYIHMTAEIMKRFGVAVDFDGMHLAVKPQQYRATHYTIESDWSAASYWFSFVALAEQGTIYLPKLSLNSLQGDHAIALIMASLGATSRFEGDLLRIDKSTYERRFAWNFTHCPDLAQTVAVVCAAKGIEGHFTGLESLRIKETDRITALQTELRKIGADFIEANGTWTLVPSTRLPDAVEISTYKDHRMAMAFAPLCCLMDVTIENPDVVRKSYPRFWDDVASAGVSVQVRQA